MIRRIPVGGGVVVLITPVPPQCAACGEYAPDHAAGCDERTTSRAPLSTAERLRRIRDAAARQRPRQDT